MLVHQILRSKADFGVMSLKPDAKVSEAVTLLSEKRIGTVVISKDGSSPDGILSERDIVRELGKHGPACLDKPVSSMMTAKIVTCTENDSADAILTTMTNGRFRHIPVVKDGRMIGLVSIGDVVKARLSELAMERDALEGMISGH